MLKNIIKKEIKNFDKKLFIKILIFTLIFGFIIHGYGYFNVVHSHDSLTAFNQNGDITWKIQIGRFMQAFSIMFRGFTPVPWITGLLSLIYMGIANYFLIKVLNIKKITNIFIILAILISSVTFTITNAVFFHENDAFMLGYLFAVLAAYTFKEYKYGFIISSILIMISCGFYQAYLSVTALLFLLILIDKIYKKNKFKEIFLLGIKALVTLVIGSLIYYVTQSIFVNIFNLEVITSYNSVNNAYSMFNSLLPNFLHTYLSFGSSLLMPYETINILVIILNVIILLITIYLTYKTTFNKTTITKNKILYIILLILIPPACCIMYIVTNGLLHVLMISAVYLFYIYTFYVLEQNKANKAIKTVLYVCFSLLILNNFIYANTLYYNREIINTRTYDVMSNINYDLNQIPEYKEGISQVLYVGNIDALVSKDLTLDYTPLILTYPRTYLAYNNYVLGNKLLTITDQALIDKYTYHEDVVNLQTYPSNEYITVVDNIFIIKLS